MQEKVPSSKEKSQQNRIRILREFIALYEKNGYEKTTMMQLSSACNMSVGHIRFYYKKKENLFFSVLDNTMKCINDVVEEMVDLPDDLLLNVLFKTMAYTYLTNQDEIRYRQMVEILENPPLLDRMVAASYRLILKSIRQLKLPVDDLDIQTGSNCAVASYYITAKHSYNANLPLNYYRIFKVFCDILFLYIDFPATRASQEMVLSYFEELDKDLFLEKFYRLFNQFLSS